MAQPIQIILMRRLAEYLSVPLFLVGPNGDLLFYNEPAEAILGRRFDETGAMSAKEWSSAFTPEDSEGHAVPPEDVPLMITITKKRPAYQRFFIRGLDGVRRHVVRLRSRCSERSASAEKRDTHQSETSQNRAAPPKKSPSSPAIGIDATSTCLRTPSRPRMKKRW